VISVGHVARNEAMRNAYNISVLKPEEKISLERPRSRQKDNIKMDVREIGNENMDWIHLA